MDKYSLRGQVFQEIREDILKGKFKENEELREATLGKKLGVSRTPVRKHSVSWSWRGWFTLFRTKGPM